VAVTLAVLLAVAVTAYFLFPRMPTIERKGESNLTLQLVPFVLNFTENFVIDNPNYVSLSVHVRLAVHPSHTRADTTHAAHVTHTHTHHTPHTTHHTPHTTHHTPHTTHTRTRRHKTQKVLTHMML
jgi:hypothetical protein